MNSFEKKNVLVTGAAGFIGSHLCDKLLETNLSKLVGVDNLFLGKEKNLEESKKDNRFLFEKTDVTIYDDIKKVIFENNIDVIFHLAVLPLEVSLEDPVRGFDLNVIMTRNLLEIMRNEKPGIKMIAYSSSEVYGTALYTPMDENHPMLSHTPYAASKTASDLLAYSYHKTFNLDVSILRPFNNYGPRQNEGSYAGIIPKTIKRLINGDKPLIYDDGKQTRDFIFVKDTAHWTVKFFEMIENPGQIMNLASGIQTSVEKVISSICKAFPYDGEIEYLPKRAGDVRTHEGDMKLAREILDFKLTVAFDDGIKEHS